MAAIFVFQWMNLARKFVKGQNTAPLYLKIMLPLSDEGGAKEKLKATARSNISKSTIESECFFTSGDGVIFRWKWVLLEKGSIEIKSESDLTAAGIWVAFDGRCRNEVNEPPNDLCWKRIPSVDISKAVPGTYAVNVTAHSSSFLPIAASRGCLNWGGDMRLLLHALPFETFPWVTFILLWIIASLQAVIFGLLRAAPGAASPSYPMFEAPDARRSVTVFGAVAVLVVGVLAAITVPVYDVNDDFHMLCLLIGNFGFSVGPRCLFMSTVLGHLLSGLYAAAPTIPWYPVMLYLVTMSGAYFLSRWLQPNISDRVWLSVAVTASYLCLWMFQVLTSITFSLVAEIATLGGLVGLLEASWACSSLGLCFVSRCRLMLPPTFLGLVGALLRFEAYAATCIVAVPVLLYFFWSPAYRHLHKFKVAELYTAAGWSLGVSVVGLLCWIVDGIALKTDSEWQSWHTGQALTAPLTDYGAPVLSQYIETTCGETSNVRCSTLMMFSKGFRLDDVFWDIEFLEGVKESLREFRPKLSLLGTFHRAQSNPLVITAAAPELKLLLTCGFALVVVAFIVHAPTRHATLFSTLWMLLIFVMVTVVLKPVPYRVGYGLALVNVTMILVFLFRGLHMVQDRRRWIGEVAVLLVLVISGTAALLKFGSTAMERYETHREFVQETEEFLGRQSEPFILNHFPNSTQPIFADLGFLRQSLGIPTGYLAGTPPAKSVRGVLHFGQSPDVLMEKKRLIIVAPFDRFADRPESMAQTFKNYFEAHTLRPVEVTVDKRGRFWFQMVAVVNEG